MGPTSTCGRSPVASFIFLPLLTRTYAGGRRLLADSSYSSVAKCIGVLVARPASIHAHQAPVMREAIFAHIERLELVGVHGCVNVGRLVPAGQPLAGEILPGSVRRISYWSGLPLFTHESEAVACRKRRV